MPLFAVAAVIHGNMLIEAFSQDESILIALEGGGVFEPLEDSVPEVVHPIDVLVLEDL
jgi:hypothetical protein